MLIPEEMKAAPRWVLHKDKRPKRPDWSSASSTDSSTWVTFDEAYAAYKGDKDFSGLGFVLGDGWAGVDLDDCLDDFRAYRWGKDIVDQFDTYAERSPGMYGVKLFFKTENDLAIGKNWDLGDGKRLEVYTHGRYFTVTGECLTSPRIRTTDQHIELVKRYGDLPQQPLKVDPLACVEGCREQLKALPDSVQGEGGHNALFRAACEIWRWGVTDAQAHKLIHEYNDTKCFGPWSDWELERKLRETRPVVLGEGSFGTRVAVPFGEVLEATNSRFPTIRKADELVDADLEVEYMIEGILAKGQHTLMLGAEKTLKTSIALDLGISIASGAPFLGKGKILEPGPVLMLSAESGLPTLRENALEVAKAKGVDLRRQEWYVADETIQLTDVAAVRWAGEQIDDLKLKLLIIDPLYLSMGTASSDVSNMMVTGQALQGIAQVAARKGCTVVFLHHTSKGAQRAKKESPIPSILDAAQAGFASHTRQWITIGRVTDFEPNAAEHKHSLAVGFGGSAGHAEEWSLEINVGKPTNPEIGRKWEVEARPYDPQADEERQVKANVDMIAAEIGRFNGEGLTVSAIKKEYGNKKPVLRAVERLKHDPRVIYGDVTYGNNQKAPGFKRREDISENF